MIRDRLQQPYSFPDFHRAQGALTQNVNAAELVLDPFLDWGWLPSANVEFQAFDDFSKAPQSA